MILNDDQIKDALAKGAIVIEPCDEEQVQGASYDLGVGPQGVTASGKKLVDIEKAGYLLLEPGDVGVVTTLEVVRLDQEHVGRFGLRSKYTRRGVVASTGPQIAPGFHGRLILSLINLAPNPVPLSFKEGFVSVEFHRLDRPASTPYSGPYQDKLKIGAEEIEFITDQAVMSFSEIQRTVGSLSRDVEKLADCVENMSRSIETFEKSTQRSLDSIKWYVTAIVGAGIAVMGIIAALK